MQKGDKVNTRFSCLAVFLDTSFYILSVFSMQFSMTTGICLHSQHSFQRAQQNSKVPIKGPAMYILDVRQFTVILEALIRFGRTTVEQRWSDDEITCIELYYYTAILRHDDSVVRFTNQLPCCSIFLRSPRAFLNSCSSIYTVTITSSPSAS